MSMEQKYKQFLENLAYPFIYHNIDYIGVNIDSKDSKFKMYWSDHCNVKQEYWITKWANNNGMFHYQETIEHESYKLEQNELTSKIRRFQCDLRLKNRNNKNMEELFSVLKNKEKIFEKYEEMIREISEINIDISWENKERYSALYFLGYIYDCLIENQDFCENNVVEQQLKVLKLHWINRKCKDSNILYKDFLCDDNYFLDYLKDVKNTKYYLITDLVKEVAIACKCHLWMNGLDIDERGLKKYKIYIKYPKNAYSNIQVILNQYNMILHNDSKTNDTNLDDKIIRQYRAFAKRIEEIENWHYLHTELVLEGIAFGIDDDDICSINFYYGIQEEYFK